MLKQLSENKRPPYHHLPIYITKERMDTTTTNSKNRKPMVPFLVLLRKSSNKGDKSGSKLFSEYRMLAVYLDFVPLGWIYFLIFTTATLQLPE
jgi:hypothetical protein